MEGYITPVQPISGSFANSTFVPVGNIEITDTNLVNVAQYATAQIVDENLVAENIAEDVEILGITGTHSGGGGGEATDYVIAVGHDTNNVTWRKWNSGLSEWWGETIVTNVSCTTSAYSGAAYLSASISSGHTFPTGLFLTGSGVTMQISFHDSDNTSDDSFALVWNDGSQGTTEPCTVKLMRFTSGTASGRLSYYFKGRWKDPS